MPTSLLDLPGELRNPIYTHLLISPTPIELCFCTGHLRRTAPKSPLNRRWHLSDSEDDNSIDCLCRPPGLNTGPFTAILAANRQTYAEANHLLYKENCFVIFATKWASLRAFLRRIGRDNAALIRHMCIPFPRVRLPLGMEDVWSSDDEESMNGPPNFRGYKNVSKEPLFRVSNPALLNMLSSWCTGLERLETVVGTAVPDPNVTKRGLVVEAMVFLDTRIWGKMPSLKKFIVNLYDHPQLDQEWVDTMKSCGWVVEKRPHVPRRPGVSSSRARLLSMNSSDDG
ncbi:hypothetical protein QBC34DRAFT_442806 [Podospora aff. communis PSN243]|uniref:DUF7730 domain-containing protein n=1 Tax=Podospora aff. communis PSN243 TaxID=3040156 RepID=A0AAV9G7Q4_9PEZI|nr:hypothetical protein QBC34DRAFT_442806 [Podospora aff. communis PSN243]